MQLSLADRRSEVLGARDRVRQRLAAKWDRLRRAPVWWRPGLKAGDVPPRRREEARGLQRVADEIAEDRALLTCLDDGLTAIDEGHVDLEVAHREALEWFNGLRTGKALLEGLERDPVSEALAPEQTTNAKLAAGLLRFRNAQPRRRVEDLRDLAGVPGVTDAILADLLHTGLRRLPWPWVPRPRRRPTIGVLLPARLETRFDPPDSRFGSWHMRVRIVPDEPWFDQHDPTPTKVEIDSVERLWHRVGDAGLDSDVGRVAWAEFVAAHGGGRAAWLARSYPPVASDDGEVSIERPAEIREEVAVNRIVGFPRQIELWLARDGAPPTLAARLDVDREGLTIQPGDPDEPAQRRWWESWEKAVAVGLAADVDLGPVHPGDIEALYVIGIGDTEAEGLFADHRDSGRLALLAPGSPTNTIDGAPAADLGNDPETWLPMVTTPPAADPGTARLSEILTGQPDALGPLPGGRLDHGAVSALLVTALWPALWGHLFKDLWGLGPAVHEVGLWAARAVFPEGPVAPIRIGTQPYGVLPATSLNRWRAAVGDPPVEEQLAKPLSRVRAHSSWLAEAAGSVDGADTDRLLQLLGRTASSTDYAWRHFVAEDLLLYLYWSFGEAVQPEDLERLWQEAGRSVLDVIGREPPRRYFSVGWPQDLGIPLVTPTNLPEGMTLHDVIKTIVRVTPGALTYEWWPRELIKGAALPDSLLFRLLVYSMVLTAAEAARAARAQPPEFVLEPPAADESKPTKLAADARALRSTDLRQPTSEAILYRSVRYAALRLAEFPDDVLERALRATLDSASHRIDPFVTGFAWRRLQSLLRLKPRHLLGVYGWVDSPYTGRPGPTAGGLLHAPSDAQALTAAIIRDKAVNDAQPDRWDMDVHSARARRADRIASEVRLGAHLSEVLGREIERIAGATATIQELRERFPIRTEEAGRRVCDGQAVLAANPATLPLTHAQRAELQPLRDALDTYGDLLVAEAVHHVVQGRGDVAGAAMDAAVGLGRPPDLHVLRTPRPGRTVQTVVGVALPVASAPPTAADTSPATVADPAVAAFVLATFGAADTARWRWEFEDSAGDLHQLTLDDVDLAPIDTVVLSAGTLRDRLAAQAPTGSTIISSAGAETHEQVRRLMGVLGSQPATVADMSDGSADDAAERADLLARYQQLHDVAALLQADLTSAAPAGAPTADQEAALHNALRWGITPLEADEPDLRLRVVRARDALETRLQAAPTPGDAAGLDTRSIARAIAELAAPEGNLAVLGRVDLTGIGPFTAESTDATTGLPDLDALWLDVVAAVRTPLARLQQFQLSAVLDPRDAPFGAWTNRPGDAWQESEPPTPEGRLPNTRLLAVYGPAGVLDSAGTVALGLLDRWAEVVPDTVQSTSAAFGFNAPAARAQQSILVAVPPDAGDPLDAAKLIDIVAETRELAHARMVTPLDIALYSAAAPSALLPATGTTAVLFNP